MKEQLLSVVTDEQGNQEFLHMDLKGVNHLLSELSYIKNKLENDDCSHTHLSSEEYGGSELTVSKLAGQPDEVNCVHHLKIYGWNDEWKKKHALVKAI